MSGNARPHRGWWLAPLIALCLWGAVAANLSAQDAPTTTAASSRSNRHNDARRERAFTVGLLLLAVVLLAGVGLLAGVLIWGARLRRVSRAPLPTVRKQDELWFLRARKKDVAGRPPSAENEDT